MTDTTAVDRFQRPRITHVPKHIFKAPSKVKPADQTLPNSSIENASTLHLDSLVSIPSQTISVLTDTTLSPSKLDRSSTPDPLRSLPTVDDKNTNKDAPATTDEPKKTFADRLKCLKPRQILALKILVVSVVVLLAVTAIVVPLVLVFGVKQSPTESSFTNMSVSSCASTTCIGQETPFRTSIVTVLYPFDGNMNDLTGYDSGTPFGTTIPAANVQGYIGQALSVASGSQQYVQISSVNLSQQSFTIQLWIYPTNTNTSGEQGIFGQCDSSSICFSLSLRNARVGVSFDSVNNNSSPLIGSTLITAGVWIHLTVVYDAVLRQQQIYVNGAVDAVSYGLVSPYRGSSSGAVTTIGRTAMVSSGFAYFDGRIDHITVSAGTARYACEILNDATLIAYYPLDTVATANDFSIALSNGIASGTTAVSAGRVGQAISFPLLTSYFQAQCFSSLRNFNPAFTTTLWINPSVTINGGSLVHVSTTSNGGGNCYDLLVFTAGGALVMQYLTGVPSVIAIQGPLVSVNTWTHVAAVFDRTNGLRLYINGQLASASVNTGNINYDGFIPQMYVTLANISPSGPSASTTCSNGSIPIASGSYTGAIDDFRLYNRELNSQELCVLANP